MWGFQGIVLHGDGVFLAAEASLVTGRRHEGAAVASEAKGEEAERPAR